MQFMKKNKNKYINLNVSIKFTLLSLLNLLSNLPIKEIKFVIKNLTTKKADGPDNFY